MLTCLPGQWQGMNLIWRLAVSLCTVSSESFGARKAQCIEDPVTCHVCVHECVCMLVGNFLDLAVDFSVLPFHPPQMQKKHKAGRHLAYPGMIMQAGGGLSFLTEAGSSVRSTHPWHEYAALSHPHLLHLSTCAGTVSLI